MSISFVSGTPLGGAEVGAVGGETGGLGSTWALLGIDIVRHEENKSGARQNRIAALRLRMRNIRFIVMFWFRVIVKKFGVIGVVTSTTGFGELLLPQPTLGPPSGCCCCLIRS